MLVVPISALIRVSCFRLDHLFRNMNTRHYFSDDEPHRESDYSMGDGSFI